MTPNCPLAARETTSTSAISAISLSLLAEPLAEYLSGF